MILSFVGIFSRLELPSFAFYLVSVFTHRPFPFCWSLFSLSPFNRICSFLWFLFHLFSQTAKLFSLSKVNSRSCFTWVSGGITFHCHSPSLKTSLFSLPLPTFFQLFLFGGLSVAVLYWNVTLAAKCNCSDLLFLDVSGGFVLSAADCPSTGGRRHFARSSHQESI